MAIKIAGTGLGDQSDPGYTVGTKTFKKREKNFSSYSLVPSVFFDRQVLYIGITDTVTESPSHPYNCIPIRGNHKAMTTSNHPWNEALPVVIMRLPPSLYPIHFGNLEGLFLGRFPNNDASYRVFTSGFHLHISVTSPNFICFNPTFYYYYMGQSGVKLVLGYIR